MPNALYQRLHEALEGRRWKETLRSLDAPLSAGASDPEAGPPLVDFSSNDYLSFSTAPPLRRRLIAALSQEDQTVLGPSSSRLLDGNTPLHCRLEDRLAAFFCGRAALLFNSGYDANVGIWSTLPGPEDWIVYDESIHASTHDGMRASRTPKERRLAFAHNSAVDLRDRIIEILEADELVGIGQHSVFVAVEALYSMDGDVCPLQKMADTVDDLLHRGNGHLLVDEAHSTGVYGPYGRGLTCATALTDRIFLRLHTFGKAAACSGAVVICPPTVREYLINYARPLIYSTAMPRLNVLAINAAISELQSDHQVEAVARLNGLSTLLVDLLRGLFMELGSSSAPDIRLPWDLIHPSTVQPFSPIVPILTSQPRDLSAYLVLRGYLVRPIVCPTVPQQTERVRICLHAANTADEVHGVVQAIRDWMIHAVPPSARSRL